MKHLVSRLSVATNLYLLNVKGDEVRQYEKMHKKTHCIGFGSLKSIKKNSFVVAEDIISLSAEESKQLRHAVNYTAHHMSSKIFCVTHTVYKTGIYSLLPLFHYIILTSSASNQPIVRSVLNYFKIDKDKVSDWLVKLKLIYQNSTSPEVYFFFDCNKMELGMSTKLLLKGTLSKIGTVCESQEADSGATILVGSPSGRAGAKRLMKNSANFETMTLRFSNYFQNHPQSGRALAIFSTLLDRFGTEGINPIDLSFSFRLKNQAGAQKKISAVDYIANLLDPDTSARLDHRVLHNFISSRCVIPTCSILNSKFLE